MLKNLRLLHRYIGLFISPAILFFALTGALQTFSLHEFGKGTYDKPRLGYQPASWIVLLAQIHKNQTPVVPPAKVKPAEPPKPKVEDPGAPKPPVYAGPAHNPMPLKYFFLLVAIGLFTSTLTGIYMAYKFERSKALVTVILVLGMIVPVLLTVF